MYRIYRVINDIPGRPERRGEVVRVEDLTDDALVSADGRLVLPLCGLPGLRFVLESCASMRRFYAQHGVDCRHVVAVVRGTTTEYVEAP